MNKINLYRKKYKRYEQNTYISRSIKDMNKINLYLKKYKRYEQNKLISQEV